MAQATKARFVDTHKVEIITDADGAYDGTGVGRDMRDYERICVIASPTTTTPTASHLIESFNLISNTTAAGGGTDHIIAEAVTAVGGTTDTLTAADMGTVDGSTLTDQFIALDVGADDMYPGDRYISALTTGTGTNPTVFIFIRYNGNFQTDWMIQATRTAGQYTGDLT